jgi:hypothetical protein
MENIGGEPQEYEALSVDFTAVVLEKDAKPTRQEP